MKQGNCKVESQYRRGVASPGSRVREARMTTVQAGPGGLELAGTVLLQIDAAVGRALRAYLTGEFAEPQAAPQRRRKVA